MFFQQVTGSADSDENAFVSDALGFSLEPSVMSAEVNRNAVTFQMWWMPSTSVHPTAFV